VSEYSKAYTMRFNGVSMAEVSEAVETITSNDKEVETLSKGMAGHSDGPEMVRYTAKTAIPIAGYERDFAEFCRTHKTVTLEMVGGGKSTTAEGRFTEVTTRSSVGTPNETDFTFTGRIVSRVAV
jgi:hypothetical protein